MVWIIVRYEIHNGGMDEKKMHELFGQVEQYWKPLGLVIVSILWVGRLNWRVAVLETEKNKPKKPTVCETDCKENRDGCRSEFKISQEHLTKQVDMLVKHLINKG